METVNSVNQQNISTQKVRFDNDQCILELIKDLNIYDTRKIQIIIDSIDKILLLSNGVRTVRKFKSSAFRVCNRKTQYHRQ